MTLALVVLSLIAVTAQADPPPGYYDSVDMSSQAAMRVSLHNIIDDHTKIPYTSSSTDTWNVLEVADEDPFNSGRILDLYQNRVFTKHGTGNNDYNREHVWPKSFGFPDDGSSNYPYTDCHHLFLCDIGYNGDRANYPFDVCSSGCSERVTDNYGGQGGGSGSYPGNSNWVSSAGLGHWETWIGRRGDVARAILYMDLRYEGGNHGGTGYSEPDLIITDDLDLIADSSSSSNLSVAYMGLKSILLAWHEQDPVDDVERAHNDGVYTYQGNRNPFVDHPEWVERLYVAWAPSDVPGVDLSVAGITRIYPNPFNPSTHIDYAVGTAGPVRIEVYAVDGRRIRSLVNEHHVAGEYSVHWDGNDAAGNRTASGIYFGRLVSGSIRQTHKLVMLK